MNLSLEILNNKDRKFVAQISGGITKESGSS